MKLRKGKQAVIWVLIRTIQRLHPRIQKETPACFVIYFGAVFLTVCSIFTWLFGIFSALYLRFALILWGFVLFMQFCEAIEDARHKEDNLDLKPRK